MAYTREDTREDKGSRTDVPLRWSKYSSKESKGKLVTCRRYRKRKVFRVATLKASGRAISVIFEHACV